jgi:hypothetical protein
MLAIETRYQFYLLPRLSPWSGRFRRSLHVAMQNRLYLHPLWEPSIKSLRIPANCRSFLLIVRTQKIVTALPGQLVPWDTRIFQQMARLQPHVAMRRA